MRLDALVILSMVLVAGQASAEPRDHQSGSTARHPEKEERQRPAKGFSAAPDRGAASGKFADPSVSQFWSDRCVSQRRFGLPHTRDCDNPAYSGGGYGTGVPYRGYGPHGAFGDHGYGWPGGSRPDPYEYRRPDGPPTVPRERPHRGFRVQDQW